MAAPKGHERYGGRKRGTPNKASVKRAEELASTGLTPLDYMINTLRNEDKEDSLRMDAAKSAAPYIHPKLSAIEMTGKDGAAIEVKDVSDIARRLAFLLASGAESIDKKEQ